MPEPLHLTPIQQTAALLGSLLLLVSVVALIYQRKLREDYGALWFTAAAATVVLAIWQDGLRLIATALESVTLTAPIFLLSILFLTAVAIHYSVRFTTLSRQVRDLAREISLLRAQRGEASTDAGARGASQQRELR